MQWLIDIIKEWVIAQRYLTTSCVHRGYTSTWDWFVLDFIKDGAWHDLDCSSIVPQGAKFIVFAYQVQATAVAKKFFLRCKGDITGPVRSAVSTTTAFLSFYGDMVCACDDNQQVQYWITPDTWLALGLVVKGWWF